MNVSKWISEEVVKAIDVSLRHIDNYNLYGERTLIIGQITCYDGGVSSPHSEGLVY